MSKYRRAAKIDNNQKEIVELLRKIGYSVEVGHDDILVGAYGLTFWYEIKSPDAVSKKTGEILESEIKPDQKRIRSTFLGHYKIVHSIEEIIKDIETKSEKR